MTMEKTGSDAIKKVGASVVLDSGLLFKINQMILHPFGLALEVVVPDSDEELQKEIKEIEDAIEDVRGVWTYMEEAAPTQLEDIKKYYNKVGDMLAELIEIKLQGVRFGQVWDYRDDPEGMSYTEETLEHGDAKFKKFMDESGRAKLKQRFEKLGFIIQGESDANEMYEN